MDKILNKDGQKVRGWVFCVKCSFFDSYRTNHLDYVNFDARTLQDLAECIITYTIQHPYVKFNKVEEVIWL